MAENGSLKGLSGDDATMKVLDVMEDRLNNHDEDYLARHRPHPMNKED